MSQQRRGGLGRGLAALIPSGPTEGPRLGAAAADVMFGAQTAAAPKSDQVTPTTGGSAPSSVADPAPVGGPDTPVSDSPVGAVYRELRTADISPNPKQPRLAFDEEALAELVHSIREFGLMQPIVVREDSPGHYELVMGERRWRATQEAGLETIPAIVRDTADEAMLRDALLENIHRVQLNPLEEAAAYQQLLEEFGVTHEELATRIGRSRPVVSNTIRLLRLPVPVQRRVAAGVLSAGHARALLSLDGDPMAQEDLAARIVAEGLSVRATEEAITLARRHADEARPSARGSDRRPARPPVLQEVAARLSDSFDTKVTVSLGQRKGRIVVEFGSVDDLDRIVGLMSSQGDGTTVVRPSGDAP
ncbi:ParB/RepB/Spo0J family partition protein [Rhodococcus sp. X156]|uniref:ParB/RepB/Spo0J family partition protein n=1 Tax=Rhodococcus sp. X156 TaxID=2499145 RepID=UPI000FD8F0CD|nr:ParB/RepB/Spo0J family partition protein [Rhodococcus sp. X156]